MSAEEKDRKEPTCSNRGEQGLVNVGLTSGINPEYWAPSRHWANSYVEDLRGFKVKAHLLSFQWYGDKSLAWLCSSKRLARRGVEIEARVPYLASQKFSTGWVNDPPRAAHVTTNLPKSYYRDDIAIGNTKKTRSWDYILSKQDYPDFAIVSDKQRRLRYRRAYYTLFYTNDGGENATAPVQFTAAPTRYARREGGRPDEKDYCDRRKGYKNCQFTAGVSVCYNEGNINGPQKVRTIDWGDILGTRYQRLTAKNTSRLGRWNASTGDVTYPCVPKRE